MPSNHQRFTYLQHILRDGHTPFHYRNGVRALLGMPEHDHVTVGQHYSPSSVPIGFRYRQREDSSSSQFDLKEAFWLGKRNKETQTGPMPTIPTGDRNQGFNKGNSNPELPLKGSFSDQKASLSASSSASSMMPDTKKSTSFLGVQSRQDYSTKGQRTSHGIGPATNPCPQETAPLLKDDFRAEAKPANKHASAIDIPGKSPARTIFPLLSHDPVPDLTGQAEEKAVPSQSAQHSPQSENYIQPKTLSSNNSRPSLTSVSPPLAEKSYEITRTDKKLTKPLELPPDHTNVLPQAPEIKSLSSNAANQGIVRLQQAVQELTAKQSRSRSTEEIDPQPAQSPQRRTPSSQPVVVVQQSPRRFKTPDAFWERSHLGKIHLRLLR